MRYSFLTTWLLAVPREEVWRVLEDAAAWPEWWPGVAAVEEHEPRRRYSVEWRSAIPYPVRFEFRVEEVDEPRTMRGTATGDLEGSGEWRLEEDDGVTTVTYAWDVATTKRWMNAAGPVLAPAFRWNHDRIMRAGGEALARRLGTAPIAHG